MENVEILDPGWTVHETVVRYPETVAVFNQFGIDTCCGGGVPVGVAALRDGIDADALLEAIREAVERA
jgi:regulator of cell morphogenesis and NO signaling